MKETHENIYQTSFNVASIQINPDPKYTASIKKQRSIKLDIFSIIFLLFKQSALYKVLKVFYSKLLRLSSNERLYYGLVFFLINVKYLLHT